MDTGTGSSLIFGSVRLVSDKMNPIEKVYFWMGTGETQQVLGKGFKKYFLAPIVLVQYYTGTLVLCLYWTKSCYDLVKILV